MTEPSELTLAIIAAGPLGRSLALRAVQAGVQVVLEDVMPSNLRHAQEQLRVALGEALHDSGSSVSFVSTVEDAVRQADLAIDCVPDELESKLEIFSLLDRMAPPRTVLLTPTQALSIADLASCTYRPERCLAIGLGAQELAGEAAARGAVVPLKRTANTDPAAQALVVEFWSRLGCEVRVDTDRAVAFAR